MDIPIFANGGIEDFEDIQKCLGYTKADGVMSAEALIENPKLFSNKKEDLDEVALEVLEFRESYKDPFFNIKYHLYHILYQGFK